MSLPGINISTWQPPGDKAAPAATDEGDRTVKRTESAIIARHLLDRLQPRENAPEPKAFARTPIGGYGIVAGVSNPMDKCQLVRVNIPGKGVRVFWRDEVVMV